SINVLDWSYGTLSIKPMTDANFTLSVQATDVTGAISGVANEALTVNPLAPSVIPTPASGGAGQAIPLNFGITLNGLTGDSNSLFSITLTAVPSTAILSNSKGDTLTVTSGSIIFSASQIAAGVLNGLAIRPAAAGTFAIGVSATAQDGEGNLSTTATNPETIIVSAAPPPTVTWTPSVGSGVEGIGIALGTIATSGSGLASLRVSGIPVGATLSDGTHSFVASAGNTSVDVLDWSYGSLSIKPANDANFTLTAQATDASGTVSGTATEIVTVAPLAPSVVPVAVSGAAGQAIPLDLGITPNGLAGDSNSLFSVTLSSIPSDATLSNSRGDTLTVSGGAITFSPSQLAAGVLNGLAITPLSAGTFQLGVSVVEQDAEGNHSALTSSAEAVTATGTVVTGGTISNSVTGPFVLSAASNPLFVTPTGAVTATGAANAINGGSGGPWTITNAGTLAAAATGYGVSLAADGTVSSSGLITGKDGIFLNAGGRVVNSGSIGASGAPGGGASGTGVFISHGPGSVSNDGTITGPAYGAALDYGGQVTNTRLIAGDRNGVRIGAASGGGTVVNSGTILATASDAIALGAGGTVTNAAGGLITTQGTAAA